MMKILFAASEAVPFMKTGGLADVTGSLPGYFDKKHFDVRIIMPKYLCMDEKWKAQLRFVCHFYVNLSWRSVRYILPDSLYTQWVPVGYQP